MPGSSYVCDFLILWTFKKCCVAGIEYFNDDNQNKPINKRGVSDYRGSVGNIHVSRLPWFALLKMYNNNMIPGIKSKSLHSHTDTIFDLIKAFVLCTHLVFYGSFISFLLWEPSGRVLDSRPRGCGFSLTGITVLCPWAWHIDPCLVLVQPRKTSPDITGKLLTGT